MKYWLDYKTGLPDVALYELFDRMMDAGRLDTVFHDGGIRTHHEFRDLVRRWDLHFWALMGGQVPLGMVWITDLMHRSANLHYCMFGAAHPVCELRAARFGVSTILRLKDGQGIFILDYLHGKTPVRNSQACRWITMTGFVPSGELPGAVWMAESGKAESAVLSWASRETAPAAWAGLEVE